METIVLQNDGGCNVSFSGELIAKASSKQPSGPASNRWQELKLYRTRGHKLVCSRIGRTICEGELDRFEVQIVADGAIVVGLFGASDLAKGFHPRAGISTDEKID